MYTLDNGPKRNIGRAYVIGLNGGRTLVVSGNVDRVTKARKVEMQRAAILVVRPDTDPATLADADALAAAWDRTPWCRRDSVTVWDCKVTNDDDPEDVRLTLNYEYAQGGGSWETHKVTFITI